MRKPPYKVPTMAEIRAVPWNGYKVASTFAGGGGSCTGYEMAGFRVAWANEFVPAAQETYRANHPETVLDGRDIKVVRPEDVLAALGIKAGDLDILDGSPPCQAFSTAGKREKGWGKAKRYEHGAEQCNETLFFEFARLLAGLRPKVFVAENVKGLTIGAAKERMLGDAQLDMLNPQDDTIYHALCDAGYIVRWRVLDAKDHGVPQTRNRVIFVGLRRDLAEMSGLEPTFPPPTGYVYTVRDALPWIGRVAVGNEAFEPRFGELDVPSPTILAGGARTSGLVAIEGACGFDGPQPKSVDAPMPVVTAGRPVNVVQQAVLVEDTTGLFSKGLGRHRMIDGDKRPHPPVATTPTRVQVMPRPDADKLLESEARVIHDTTGRGELHGPGDGSASASFSKGDVTDQPCPCVTVGVNSLNSSHFKVVRRVQAELGERPQLKSPAHGGGGFGKGPVHVDPDQPSPAVMAGGIGGQGMTQHDVEATDISGFAIGAEWDKLAPGGQSDKYFSPQKADPEKPSPAVTACGGNGSTAAVVHPTEKRKFTIAELKRICAFPDDYVLTGSYAQQWARLGNSVPPVMMARIARHVLDTLLSKVAEPDFKWRLPEQKPEEAKVPAPAPKAAKAPAAAKNEPAKPKDKAPADMDARWVDYWKNRKA